MIQPHRPLKLSNQTAISTGGPSGETALPPGAMTAFVPLVLIR
jgi:hypothetical protein